MDTMFTEEVAAARDRTIPGGQTAGTTSKRRYRQHMFDVVKLRRVGPNLSVNVFLLVA